MSSFELTPEEQANLRAAIRCLKAKLGDWRKVEKVLHGDRKALARGQVHPLLAFKVARVANVGVDDVLTGRFPGPGVCRHCGHRQDEEVGAAAR